MEVSYEIIPPKMVWDPSELYDVVAKLLATDPVSISVTSHPVKFDFQQIEKGVYKKVKVDTRVSQLSVVAWLLKNFPGIKIIPHVTCQGKSKSDLLQELSDFKFLGIDEIFIIRGDGISQTRPTDVLKWIDEWGIPFIKGVACYPEKYRGSPNIERDIEALKLKQDLGADYAITQMFFDNSKFFQFCSDVRAQGITMPIIPGIKPLTKINQLSSIPENFSVSIPRYLEELVIESPDLLAFSFRDRCRELFNAGFERIHMFTMNKPDFIISAIEKL